MHRLILAVAAVGLGALAASGPTAAFGGGEAADLEHARANARAGGPVVAASAGTDQQKFVCDSTTPGGADGATATGSDTVACGTNARANGDRSTAIGSFAGFNAAGTQNSFFGYNTGVNVNGDNNTATGANAGQGVTGFGNVATGSFAGSNVTGDSNIAVGLGAGDQVTGSGNTATGILAGFNVNGDNNAAYGANAGFNFAVPGTKSSNNSSFGQLRDGRHWVQ